MDIFAPFYETFENIFSFFDNQFNFVFQTMYDDRGYSQMGLIFILVSLFLLLAFYLLWKYPYGKLWHWCVWLGIISVTVLVLTYNSASLTLGIYLIDPNPDLANYTQSLIIKYAILNAILSIVASLIFSLGLRRFSKIQMHLPF
jgi:vacuolar-type H+-ATPase subunit I/STV1